MPQKKKIAAKKTAPQKKTVKKSSPNKIKVSDLAKELGLNSPDLLTILKDLGVVAKTAASSIDLDSAKTVKEVIEDKASESTVKQEKQQIEVKETPKPAAAPPPPPVTEPVPAPSVPTPPPLIPTGIVIETEDISVKDLAEKIKVRASELIKPLLKKGVLATINQRINSEIARDIAREIGIEVTVKIPPRAARAAGPEVKRDNLKARCPIVTIMGHVDHGKTKLLDAIRSTKVAEGEAGGITQHIGAYQVTVQGKKVTFLDTPGHEAFTALRARGASVTDIAVLVVAADDGVKPQTIEAIDHAKAAGVSIIVAINKIDKPDSNLDRVKKQLAELGLTPEEWGGKTIMVHTSAREKTGIEELLEMILLEAEVLELQADPKGTTVGVVIESRLDKGKGPVADLLVQNGTLKIGDIFNIGATYGKVRALFNEHGDRLKEAGPATPVELLGSIDVPTAGDTLQVVGSEKEARELAESNKIKQIKSQYAKVISLVDISKQAKGGEKLTLNLVIKADVQGSISAINQSISGLTIGNVSVNIIHQAVGNITESDIILAKASNAIVAGFSVGYEGSAELISSKEGVEVRLYDIIYKLIDDIKLAAEGMLKPEYEEVVAGHAEVRNLFKFSKVGVIAGCFVTDGKLVRGALMKLYRGRDVVYEGKLEALKRFKDDVKSVEANFECGVSIVGYTNFQVGDIVEAIEIREKARKK